MTDTTKRVDRFDCTNGRAQFCYGCYQMTTDNEYGDYVKYEDYAALLLRASDLTADRDSWRRLAERLESEKLDAEAKLAERDAEVAEFRRVDKQREEVMLALHAEARNHRQRAEAAERARDDACQDVERLNAIINTPQADDFLRAVSIEAEHQRQRWGNDHDSGKTAADWFWLIGYLAGKALHSAMHNDATKAEHHVITTAAACANWHKAMNGETSMRPGIDGAALLAAKEGGGTPAATGTVADIPDAELLGRAVRNVTKLTKRQPPWARIMDVFALGSTYSAQLCRRFGIDPDTGKRDDAGSPA